MEKLETTHIGKLALDKNIISKEQLAKCIEILNESEGKKIEEVLLSYLSDEVLESLLKKRKLNIKKLQDYAFGEYVTKMKMIPEERLQYCSEIQRRALQQKTYIPLWNILVSHGVLSQSKVDRVLKAKEIRRFVRQALSADDPQRTGLKGRVLGGYEIISEIASGGMGIVYIALQLELNRKVAFKILFEQFASKRKHLNQFYREARLSAMLNHPNLVHIFEVGTDQGFHYYSMEIVEGVNLGDRLRDEGKFNQEEGLDLIIQAGKGLEHIHSFDIVHRDIKPSNFIIRDDGILKIMDLGLATQTHKSPKKASTMGTPYYMSPELIHNPQEANHRADIYALGVSFYRMLTGEYPITGSDAREILKNIKEQIPIPVTQLEPEMNQDMSNIIDKMITKDHNERYQNMTDVLNDLNGVLLID